MASFITFDPPLDRSFPRFEILAFFLGNQSDTKGADGRGYPAHMRRLWVMKVREALVHIHDPIEFARGAPRVPPQFKHIKEAAANGTTFKMVDVLEEKRRVILRSVKIAKFELGGRTLTKGLHPGGHWIKGPAKMTLQFQDLTETRTDH
jgi:hypothetical protein